jgi:hypothetical protein
LRLELLYRIRFTYPEGWMVELDGGWQQHLYLAEGRCDGVISGRFRGANAPLRQGAAGPFRPDIRAVIEADDGSTIMFDCLGKGARIRLHAGRSSVPSFTPATPSASDASTTRSVSASVRSGRRPIPHKRPIVSSMSPSSFGGRSTIDRRPRRHRWIEAEATADQIRSGPLVRMSSFATTSRRPASAGARALLGARAGAA